MERREVLVRELRAAEELPVVEVVTGLLRVCRDLAEALDHEQQRLERDGRWEPYREVMADTLAREEPIDPEFLDAPVLRAISGLLSAAQHPGDLAVRARDIATALDEARGSHLFNWFAGQRLRRGEDDPVPVTTSDVVAEELGSRGMLTPESDSLEAALPSRIPIDGTRRIRLVPRDRGRFHVELDARFSGTMDALFTGPPGAVPGPDVRWCAIVPSCRALDELTFDPIDEPVPRFYGVRPAPEQAADYQARLERGLAIAAEHGANIVVLPELSVDAALEALVVDWFASTRSVKLMVAGSRHLSEPGAPRRNRARVLIRGANPLEALYHDKFSTFAAELHGVWRQEDIERPNAVTIVAGRRWSFAPMICRDFLDTHVASIVAALRVRTLLVPSMTTKTDVFRVLADSARYRAQAIVLVANGALFPEDDAAIFAVPRRGELVSRRCPSPTSGLVMISTAKTNDVIELEIPGTAS